MNRFAWSAVTLFLVLAGVALGPIRGEQHSFDVATFCTPYPTHTRPPITVSNSTELQNALDDARAGDTILLAAGATFQPVTSDGSFVLRNRSIPAGQGVIIRSSSPAFDADGQIPPNKRVTPADAKLMPKLRATRPTVPVIRADAGAHGYRLVGLDIGVDPGVDRVTALVELGGGSDTTPATEPYDIVIDRCYLHGNDAGNFRRGVAMNGARLAVIESHLENFHDFGDSQAIAGWNGPGPFKIVNNFLEAASENVANQSGRCPHCVTEYVTFRDNVVRHAANGLVINAAETGKQGAELPLRANHIRVQNVLFLDIGGAEWGASAKLLRIFGGVSDVSITHITSIANRRGILDPRDPKDVNPRLVFSYNIVERIGLGLH